VRLFLDAHISGRRIATALRRKHRDVRAADEERALDGMTDEELLQLATEENRIMVTCNVADFPDIARRWAEVQRTHSGLAILVGIDHREFGVILRVIERALVSRSDQEEWTDLTVFVSPTGR
jgi:predicted nuclease of predicted toxin-antitoxin system